MVNFKKLGTMLLEKFSKLESYDRYKFFLSQYYLAKYKLGKENFRLTDCSGILSGALFMMGYNIRCTAQFFHDHIFMEAVHAPFGHIMYMACFIRNSVNGEITHVLPHLENGVFLQTNPVCELVTESDIYLMNEESEKDIQFRCTNEKVLSAFSISLLASTEVDEELVKLRTV